MTNHLIFGNILNMGNKKKLNQNVTCNFTSYIYPTLKGRKGIARVEYFKNGENKLKGFWIDTKEPFDLPSVFFDKVETD